MAEELPAEVKEVKERRSSMQGLVRRQVTVLNKLLLEDQEQKKVEISAAMAKLVTVRDDFNKVHAELLGRYEELDLDNRDIEDSSHAVIQESLTAFASAEAWLSKHDTESLEREFDELAHSLTTPRRGAAGGQLSGVLIDADKLAQMQAQLDELQDTRRVVSELQQRLDMDHRSYEEEASGYRRTISELRRESEERGMLSSTRRDSGGTSRQSLGAEDISAISQIISQSNVSIFRSMLDQSSAAQKEFLERSSETQKAICTSLKTANVGLVKFKGSPLEYMSFMRRFDDYMGNTEAEDSVKLNTLVEYCDKSVVKELECCFYKKADEGYRLARKLLQKKFGNPFRISQAWVERLLSTPRLESVEALTDFAISLRSCQETLSALGFLSEIECTNTMRILVSRLPTYLQNKWRKVYREATENGENAGLLKLIAIVQSAADEQADPVYGAASLEKVMNSYAGTAGLPRSSKNSGSKKKTSGVFTQEIREPATGSAEKSSPAKRKPRCWCCSEAHYTSTCPRFAKMSPESQLAFIQEKSLCRLCMSAGHKFEACYMRWTCQREGCNERHHSALHDALTLNRGSKEAVNTLPGIESSSGSEASDSEEEESESMRGVVSTVLGEYALPLTPAVVRLGSGDVTTHVLIDSGSSVTLCTTRLHRRLKVRPHDRRHLWLGSMGGVIEVDANLINLEMSRVDSSDLQQVRNVSVVDKLPVSDRHIAKARQIERWPHLRELDMPSVATSCVDMIIGQDNAHLLRHEKEVSGGPEFAPYAVLTPLGWTVYGLPSCPAEPRSVVCATSLVDTLEERVEKFWAQEEIPAKRMMSAEDRGVEERWNREMTLVGGRICLPIPFKKEPPGLPQNFHLAKKRLDCLGRRLLREPLLRKNYVAGILKNIEEGYAEWVEADARVGYENYIPHHAVVTAKKPCRIVSDASSEMRGVSLNNSVHQGPLNTNMLVDVLIKFREGRYTLTGDIRSMFNQVVVPPEHRDALRFLWWRDDQPGGQVVVGRMTTHTFGGGWCPSVASHALHMCADLHSEEFEAWIVEVIKRNFYVDDLLKSLHALDRVIQLAIELPRLLLKNRFHLTKLGSNTAEVLLHIPVEERAAAYDLLDLDLDDGAVDHALGCILYPKRDVFGFKVGDTDKPMTRRGMLSVTSSLFDPLGLLAPYVLIAKLIIQSLCQRGIGWDDELPGDTQEQWVKWLEELQYMAAFTVPRWIGETEDADRSYRLHVFVDASSRAYGAAAYFCVEERDEVVQATLLSAKSRVAPLKTVTIPRLELNAAVLGVKLEIKLREYLTCELSESVFWSDSMVVLHYLRGQSRDFKIYVANRVELVLEHSEAVQWRHVPTAVNPADYVSRGMLVRDLMEKPDWIDGPSFLRAQENWPMAMNEEEDVALQIQEQLELKKIKPVLTCLKLADELVFAEEELATMTGMLEAVSTWKRLVKVVLWLLRIKRWWKHGASLKAKISVDERREAELEIMRWAQRQYMSQKQRESPGFKKLFPFFRDGLFRVGGRLMMAQLRYEEKYPILLPEGHVADLYVQCVHEIVGHSGVERTYQEVRTRYWLIGGKRTVQKMIRRCMQCQKSKKAAAEQLMAPLPAYRVTACDAPFEIVGVDYMGPVNIKVGRSNVKRYICVFSDLVIRAMHVEVAADLSSSAFLNAFQRFTARRGCPRKVVSDNGTNFVGAEKDVKLKFDAWDQGRINERLGEKGVTWHFNTPRASHHGGVWERMIRSFRNLFMALAGTQTLSEDALSTFACAAEQIYNSRPLTRVSEDANEMLPITPAHLLNLRAPMSLEGKFTDADLIKRKWRQVQGMAEIFWKRWAGNYLKELQRRYKWYKEARNFRVGDLVLVQQDDSPRLQWPLGRVLEVYEGRDGHVRSVRVKMRDGEFNRPITKLVHLECEFPENKP